MVPREPLLCYHVALYFILMMSYIQLDPEKNMLSFKDIRHNGYHIETTYDNNKEYL